MSRSTGDTAARSLREAIALAKRHSQQRAGGPFGAVIVYQRKIISRGWNKVSSANDPTAHAEIVSIRAACRTLKRFHLSGCELYTSCEPCPMCLAAAYWARLDRIVYAATRKDAAAIGFDDAFQYGELARPVKKRSLPMKQLLRDESVLVMQRWHTMPGRVLY